MHALCGLLGKTWHTSEVLDIKATRMAWINIIATGGRARG
jgi:hypothetical protein